MGLLDALRQYISDSMPGGSLNPEQPAKLSGLLDAGKKQAQYIGGLLDPNSPISQDAQNWHKRTQIGLADQLAGRQTPEAEQAYQTMMQAAGIAPVGMIAWHGSPHKFDKFDLSKIGTGEGAQAYGHGLYLAESPAVATEYKRALSGVKLNDGSVVNPEWTDPAYYGIQALAKSGGDIAKARENVKAWSEKVKWPDALTAFDELAKKSPNLDATGNLYKTDIPDEAVARFLDWDKPLSQQAPEVQKALENLGMSKKETAPVHSWLRMKIDNMPKGMMEEDLASFGIPGIRYLDGGSRGTGTGTSNFVAFDPEMIRILERNGQPTGLQPWKPGEWK